MTSTLLVLLLLSQAEGLDKPPDEARERVQGTKVAMGSPAEMAVRAVASGARQADAFEYLLLLAGLDNVNDEPPRGAPLTPQEAARVLTVLLNKPVTLGSFPPRMAVYHLLHEVLTEGAGHYDVPRQGRIDVPVPM